MENKNPSDNLGWTPLHIAAENGHLDIVKYIVQDLDERNPKTINGETPISLARDINHHEIVTFLEEGLSMPMDVEMGSEEGMEILGF